MLRPAKPRTCPWASHWPIFLPHFLHLLNKQDSFFPFHCSLFTWAAPYSKSGLCPRERENDSLLSYTHFFLITLIFLELSMTLKYINFCSLKIMAFLQLDSWVLWGLEMFYLFTDVSSEYRLLGTVVGVIKWAHCLRCFWVSERKVFYPSPSSPFLLEQRHFIPGKKAQFPVTWLWKIPAICTHLQLL